MRRVVTDVAWSVCVCVCVLDTTGLRLEPTKTDEPFQMPFGFWTRDFKEPCVSGSLDPPGEGAISGVVPPTEMHRLCKQKTSATAQGCRLCPQGQRITAKERLQNGLTRRGGDKCGSDAAFRQNSLTIC